MKHLCPIVDKYCHLLPEPSGWNGGLYYVIEMPEYGLVSRSKIPVHQQKQMKYLVFKPILKENTWDWEYLREEFR